MKKFLLACIAVCLLPAEISAQTPGQFLLRYSNLVNRVGYCGVGVATLLDNWEKADSTDINLMLARFNYCLAASSRDSVVTSRDKKYLGLKPLMSLKDTVGVPIYYFSEKFFDDALFADAMRHIDKAIATDNTRLDVTLAKADALVDYEKGSPDMALHHLLGIVAVNYDKKYLWAYPEADVDNDFFVSLMQDYCHTFFTVGTKSSLDAFRTLSAAMLKHNPTCTLFLDNLGSWQMVATGNLKAARKFYQKALKIDPDDAAAKANMRIIDQKTAEKKKSRK